MTLNTYLNFSGQAEEAFKFYAETLKGEIVGIFKHAGSPMASQVSADWQDKVMHITLKAGDSVLMGSDVPPGHFKPSQGFSVTINLDEPAEAERIFAALSDGATIRMPLQQTFWAARFGMLVDRFGIPWMINCEGGKQ